MNTSGIDFLSQMQQDRKARFHPEKQDSNSKEAKTATDAQKSTDAEKTSGFSQESAKVDIISRMQQDRKAEFHSAKQDSSLNSSAKSQATAEESVKASTYNSSARLDSLRQKSDSIIDQANYNPSSSNQSKLDALREQSDQIIKNSQNAPNSPENTGSEG